MQQNSHWTKEDIKNLTTETVISKLKYFGVNFNKEDFIKGIKKFYSAEDLSEHWFKIYNIKASGYDEDFPWLAAYELCNRYAEENIKCDEQLDDAIIEGYDLIELNKFVEACNIWLEVWDDLKPRFKSNKYMDIDSVSVNFKGEIFLSDWVQDLEMHLYNAGARNKEFFKRRIQYCQEFMNLLPKSAELIIRNMKTAEATSYFYLGDI